jgi:hypothetical protein
VRREAAIFNRRLFWVGGFKPPLLEAATSHRADRQIRALNLAEDDALSRIGATTREEFLRPEGEG